MKLEIILQILYTNNLQDVVARAVQIENNITLPYSTHDLLLVQITKNDLPISKQFKGNEHYGYCYLPVAAVNVYSLDAPYLVTLPNGKSQWFKGNADRSSVSELIDKEVPTATPGN